VFGVGGVGLNVIQALQIAGARRIIAIDTVPTKEPLARQFGATDFIDGRDVDVVAAVREMVPFSADQTTGINGGGGVDFAFDCVGNASLIRQGIDMLDWGGTCVVIGVAPPDAEVSSRIGSFTYVDRALIGCRYGSARPHR